MFNMTKIRATNGAGKSFYANHLSANDYYSESEKIVGHWKGILSFEFGLITKEVDMDTFSMFQRGINPDTGGKLTQRHVMNGPRFFDFQCAAPKSVSIMSMFDKRLEQAHYESVAEAMRELEKLAAVRLRKGENVFTNNLEITGKIIYAEFHHSASRALDPQLHTHNVVVNVTQDSDDKFKALESVEMYRAVRYAGKVYHNKLSALCMKLGYEMENHYDDKGRIVWKDIKGIPEEVMDLYSKRRKEIEKLEAEFIEEHGRKPTLAENNQLSMSSRAGKMKTVSDREVREYQLSQLTEAQRNNLEELVSWAYLRRKPDAGWWENQEKIREAFKEALPLVFERESVVKQDKVLAEVMNQHLGEFSLAEIKKEMKNVPELRDLGGLSGNPWVSPKEVIDRELYAVKSVEEQKGVFEAIAPDFQPFPGVESRVKQAKLIHGMLNSKDRFNLFRGVAGAGKTSTLQELCNGLRSGGISSIYVIAPTNSATDVLKQEGFEQSQTVASFLLSPKKPPAGSYVIIDESGLNSLREGVEILKTARVNNYRVLFVGDARQHTAVESGDFFRLLEEHSGIEKFSLTDIHRQQNEEYRRGIMECALGQFAQAFERFDKNHFIHEGKSKYLEQAAQSYMDYTDNGRFIDQAILVAPTHDEGDRLTDAVREKLKEHGAVSQTGHTAEVFRSWSWEKSRLKQAENYAPGTVISFVRNMKDIAHAGESAKVERIENGMLYLDNGKMLYAKLAADYIEVGEMREIELCKGDLIQFNVNVKHRKIYNGGIARITDNPNKVMLLYSDGQERGLVDFPENYTAFKYGWVTTSHKSQGRTAENVVVAAQSLDRKAFYVALSRGRKNMALHCPEKEFLKQQLSFRNGDRKSVHDLVRDREISPGSILPLSEDARSARQQMLPDCSYKSIKGRTLKLAEDLKKLAKSIWDFGAKVASRRGRNSKYGLGIVTEETYLEIERNAAIDSEKIMEEKSSQKAWGYSGKPRNLMEEALAFFRKEGKFSARERITDMAQRKQKIAEMDFVFTKKMPVKKEMQRTTMSLDEVTQLFHTWETTPKPPKKLKPDEIDMAKWMKKHHIPISMEAEAAIKAENEGISFEDAYAELQAKKQGKEKTPDVPESSPDVAGKNVEAEQVDIAQHDVPLETVAEISAQQPVKSEISAESIEAKTPDNPVENLEDARAKIDELEISGDSMAAETPEAETPAEELQPEIEFVPASHAQMSALRELLEAGKLEAIPKDLSKDMAWQLIKDAVADDPLSEVQISVLQKRMERREIPKMPPEQIAGLTQKDFAELMKVQPKSVSYSTSPELEDKNKDRGMSR